MDQPVERGGHSASLGDVESRPPKLLERLRTQLKVGHYSPRTAEAYAGWVRRYIAFHGLRRPKHLNGSDIEAFLTYLAVR